MSWSWVFWIGAAVLLFWAVGAYNRLIRLRAAALQAFGALDAPLRAQGELVQACLPPSATAARVAVDAGMGRELASDELADDMTVLWGGLGGAANQFSASLAAARARPLAPDAVAALHAAQGVLAMAWARLQHDDAHDLAGAALPESVQLQWRQLDEQALAAAAAFNQSIAAYNAAISQFPAVLLAWLFGMKAARAL